MTSSAPTAFSFSAFSSLEVVAIARAPQAFANCSANSETLPEPSVRTVSPALSRRAPISAFQAVTPAQGSVAASSYVKWSGIRTSASSLRTMNSVIIPSSDPPSWGAYSQSMRPAIQRRNIDSVADSYTSYSRADLDYLPSAIGAHHDVWLDGQRIRASEDQQLPGIQRIRTNLEQHFVRTWRRLFVLPKGEARKPGA